MSPKPFPGYGYQSTQGSHSPHSQLISGIAATIQFHPGTIGCTHRGFPFPATLAGHPKHTAIPKPPVRVGVANTLTKLVAEFVPSLQPAPAGHPHRPSNLFVDIGYAVGTSKQPELVYIDLQVNAENIGTPSQTLRPSPIGFPNNVGSFHGASGAQLRGVAIHEPPQNPQLSHCISSSISSDISSIASLILSRAHIKSVAPLVLSIVSSLSGIPSPSLSTHNSVKISSL